MRDPWWTSSPICPSLGFRYTQAPNDFGARRVRRFGDTCHDERMQLGSVGRAALFDNDAIVTRCTEDWKIAAQSMHALNAGCSRYPAISLQSAEVGATKRDSKSVAHENRTKSAKCGGLDTNGSRERISDLGGRVAVRRFVREARGYWRFQRAKTRQRMLVAKGLAEGEELASNGLLICRPSTCPRERH